MAGWFDPYQEWLGVGDSLQSLNQDQLLGVAEFEADTTVLAQAAERQASRVLPHQSGMHAIEAMRRAKEIEIAKKCLLDYSSQTTEQIHLYHVVTEADLKPQTK